MQDATHRSTCVLSADIVWLRDRNAGLRIASRAGFYGLDLYRLYRSDDAVVDSLEHIDPDQAAITRRLYVAFDHARDPRGYGCEAAMGPRPPCREAAEMLTELVRKKATYLSNDRSVVQDE
jgi:erythromycin esterase-like protein